jgi:hypothetical protein
MGRNWWDRAAWIGGLVGLVLAISAAQNAFASGANAAVRIAAGIVGVNALLWGVAAFALRQRRRWGLQLGGGCAVLNLAQGIAATAAAGAAAHALAEEGFAIHDTLLTAALGWVPTIGSALFLVAVLLIKRGERVTA